MTEPSDRRVLARAAVAVAGVAMAIVIVGTIGRPIVGDGMFHGAAMVYAQYPWREERPVDLNINYGPIADTVDSTMPNRDEFASRARDGEVALWNPYIAGGVPLGATSQSGVMSPMNVPYLVLPAWAAPAWTKLIEMAVAGGFSYLFLRRLGAGRVAALLAGTAYMTSGFAVAWNNWQHPQVAALVPALFWATERHLQTRRLSSLVPIALALAVMMVSGFPAVAAYSLFLLVPYVGWRVLEGSAAGWSAERWTAVRTWFLRGATVAVGLGLGIALAAVVVLPFNAHLDTLALGWRKQVPRFHLPIENLATAVVPNALGSPRDEILIGTINTVEGLSFLGATTVLLVAVALLLRPPQGTPRGVRTYFAVALLITTWLVFVGGPVLDAVQNLPIFSNNYVARLRSMFCFQGAVLAGLGAQALVERRLPTSWKGWVLGSGAVVVLIGFLLAAFRSVNELAQAAGLRRYVIDQARIPLAVGVAGLVLVVVFLWRRDARGRSLAAAGLALLLAIETLALVVPRLPREDQQFFYPELAAHEFLADHLGSDNLATTGRTLYVSANTMNQMRAVTGHTHHQATWAQLLRAADARCLENPGEPCEVFPSPTFSTMPPVGDVMRSPVLDRLAARYFVTRPTEIPPGAVVGTDKARTDTIPVTDAGVTTQIPAQPVRGITVRFAEAIAASAEDLVVHVEIEASDGSTAAGSLRVFDAAPSDFTIPVAGEHLPDEGTMDVTVSVTGRPSVGMYGSDGTLALGWIAAPVDDGLDLVFTEGALIYEREHALPRIRWASNAEVITDPTERTEAIAAGIDADTVVLSSGGGSGEGDGGGDGEPAAITVVRDDPERTEIAVDADGEGWLVVADAKQNSWVAEIDGEEVPLVDADHALVAVQVPEGEHTVVLSYAPEGRDTGMALSLLAAAGLVALAVAGVLWRRRHPTAEPTGTAQGDGEAGDPAVAEEPEDSPAGDPVGTSTGAEPPSGSVRHTDA